MNTQIILKFLNELKENNNREWFHANKTLYDDAKNLFEQIVEVLIRGIYAFDKEIGLLEPKKCIFRIYRDVRFSNDKSPYKTNFGAFIAKGGKKSGKAGYYFHFEPGNCFIAGGAYMPDAQTLKAIRNEIFYDAEQFLEITQSPDFSKVFSNLYDKDKLKKAPKDFPKDFEHIELLKYRSYIVMRPFSDDVILKPDYLQKTISGFKTLAILVGYLNAAIENYERT